MCDLGGHLAWDAMAHQRQARIAEYDDGHAKALSRLRRSCVLAIVEATCVDLVSLSGQHLHNYTCNSYMKRYAF